MEGLVVVRDDDHEVNGVKFYLVCASGREGALPPVRRRFNEFQCLHDQLSERCMDLPEMPPRSVLRKFCSSGFREDRRRQLEHILQVALGFDPLLCITEFRLFLGLTPMPEGVPAPAAAVLQPTPTASVQPVAQAVPVLAAPLPPAPPVYVQPVAPACPQSAPAY